MRNSKQLVNTEDIVKDNTKSILECASRLRACLNQYGLLTGCKGTLSYAERRALFAEILADPAARKALRERLRNDPNRLLAVPYRIGVACNWPGLLAGYTMAKQRLL